ncbi:TetR/AcrR family transcriptional regulator [Pannonibacter phragmitetus]|uniref:TetR/AcrR family transcriptional regulator n=1 Tax=Pannonibacter phragmitetus TaxID=121719 RepID=UPI000F453717|nr:TetR/AcrR family transcriptional regulator [Pannonibacter phragmitetus]MBA4207530.1 TetR family transcriptional regulator [Polymorphum sp.]
MKHKPTSTRRPAGAALLQENLTNALMRSALIELARHGYANLTLGAVARRAKVGKPALYRRWGNKTELMADLLLHFGIPIITIEDLGSLESELEEYALRTLAMLKRPLARAILPDLYGELARNSALSDHIRVHFQEPKRFQALHIIDRAIARMEIHSTVDRSLALDLMAGPLYWRLMITKDTVETDFAAKFARAIVGALKAC